MLRDWRMGRLGFRPSRWIPSGLLALAALAQQASRQQPEPILKYIRSTWTVLTRSNRHLAQAAPDPKFRHLSDGRWPVYLPQDEDRKALETQLRHELSPRDFETIDLLSLPADPRQIHDAGLLYLPHPYVVPGGRFNEMYGWDSYFIQLGLLRDHEDGLARDMVENLLYEIRHYGKILNANRSYYLTRSQPPFLTEMLLAVYERSHDRQWLADSVPALESYYRYWTSEPHLTVRTGLSRYYDLGKGPAPEAAAERDLQGRSHYDRVKSYFRRRSLTDPELSRYYDASGDRLTALFYQGDRSMRESGFDPSDRFGPFGVEVIEFDPVCLNSLLYVMETQAADILRLLGRTADEGIWRQRAADRAERINRLMWDEGDGLYYDYNFVQHRRRQYPFLTTFYPLWAGIATPEQAARVAHALPLFEESGGLRTSTQHTGNQWDAPFGWAPLELLAVEGLRRYGYNQDADRIATKFLSLVLGQYRKAGTIVEKYDVVLRRSDLEGEIQFGYGSNERGFGWTNAVYTALLDQLPRREAAGLQ